MTRSARTGLAAGTKAAATMMSSPAIKLGKYAAASLKRVGTQPKYAWRGSDESSKQPITLTARQANRPGIPNKTNQNTAATSPMRYWTAK